MVFCLSVAIMATLYWVDSLIIVTTNAKVNPYAKTPEQEKIIRTSTIVRLTSLFIASIFWGVVIYYWN